jgi:integrase
MQRGQIFKRDGAWHLRFYTQEVTDAGLVRRRISQRLARIDDAHKNKRDVWPLAEEILSPLNRGTQLPEGAITFAEFVEKYFLPNIAAKRKPSTHKFYRDAFKNHLRDSVGMIRMRDFTTRHAQDLIDSIPLSHQSLLRIKTAMSAVFTFARQRDIIRTANPLQGVKAEGKRSKPDRYVYTLPEIRHMIVKLPEPARSVVAVAAFTGLREGEIRGLQWADYTGEFLHVRRSVWRTHVGSPKTEESVAPVPVIPLLRTILDEHRKRYPGQSWIFAGGKMGFALHLDNLSRRVIAPALGDRWHGWQSFRRGLGSNLYDLGVSDKVVQEILRHANVATTRDHYIVINSEKSKAAMAGFARALGRKWARMGKIPKSIKRKSPHKH